MKIAQIAPLEEAVPPKLYGGTERVVAYLTDALVTWVMRSLCSPRATVRPKRTWWQRGRGPCVSIQN